MSEKNLTSLRDFLKNRFNKNYLFYDSELELIIKNLDSIFKCVKNVKKRFNRRETLKVSPSLCQYVQLLDEVENAPYMLYRFVDKNVSICVCKFKGLYYVYSDGYFADKYSSYRVDSNLFGGYLYFNSAVTLFRMMTGDYLLGVVNGLF